MQRARDGPTAVWQDSGRELGQQQVALPWIAAVQLPSGSLAWHQSQGNL